MLQLLTFLIWMFYGEAYATINTEIDYQFAPQAHVDEIIITVKFKGNKSGKTSILIPILGSIDVSSILVLNNKKANILPSQKNELTQCMHEYPNYCSLLTVSHPPNEEIKLTYTARSSPGLLVEPHHVIFAGSKLLLYPELEQTKDPLIALDWSALHVRQAKRMHHGKLNDLQPILNISKEQLFASWYILTNSEIHTSFATSSSPPLVVTTVGFPKESLWPANNSFTHSNLFDLSSRIITNNQQFIANMLVKLSTAHQESVLLVKTTSNDHPWRGVKFPDVLAVLINAENDLQQAIHTISHEYLHEIFNTGEGVSVNFGPKTRWNHFWFDEGFVDYYAALLNYRHNIITKQEYVHRINNSILIHYRRFREMQNIIANPCLSSNTQLIDEILSSEAFFPNFYKAGQLIALDLDYILQSRSLGAFRLEDLLKELIKSSCKALPCKINKNQWIHISKKLLDNPSGKYMEHYIQSYIIDFHPVVLPNITFEPPLYLTSIVEKNIFSTGFDIEKTFCTGVIHDLAKTSNACKAGLKNGMKLKSFTPTEAFAHPQYWKIEIEIEDAKNKNIIYSYSPKASKLIPYYAF